MLTCIDSGEKPFGNPRSLPLYRNAFSSLGKYGLVLNLYFAMYGPSGSSSPCFAQSGKSFEST